MATVSSKQFFQQAGGDVRVVGNEAHIQQEEQKTAQPHPITSQLQSSLKSRVQGVVDQVKNIYDTATDSNLTTGQKIVGAVAEVGKTPLKVAGAVGGAVGDVVGAGLEATGANKLIGSGIEATGVDTPLAKAAEQWKAFSEKNPDLASALGDIGNLFNLEGVNAVGKGLGKTGIKDAVKNIGETLEPKEPFSLSKYASDVAEKSIKGDVDNLLSGRGMVKAVQVAEKKGVDLRETLSDPQIFEGIKVENRTVNPDKAIETLDKRIDTLLEAKREMLPEVDRLSPDITKKNIMDRASQYLKSGSGIETATVKEHLAQLAKEIDALPDNMKPSTVDKLRADFRSQARDAKGIMKSDNVYAALEKATRDAVFDATDNLPVANPGDYKALNDYVKKMIATSEFLDKNLRGKAMSGGFVRNVAARTIGAVAGSKFGFLGSILGAEGGGAIADIITNNSLGSSVKMRLIRNITDDPKILEEAEKLVNQLKDANAPGLPAAGESSFREPTMYAGDKGITPDLQGAVDAKVTPKPSFNEGAVPETANTTPKLPAGVPVQQKKESKAIDPPEEWKYAIQDAYTRYPDLPKGTLETILMMESSMGTDTRNMSKDFGKYGYLGGLTKNGHFVDTLNNLKNEKLRSKIAISDVEGIEKLDTPYAAINAVASSIAKVLRNNPDMDVVDAYFKKYVTAKGSDKPARRQAFKNFLAYYANDESPESLAKIPQK